MLRYVRLLSVALFVGAFVPGARSGDAPLVVPDRAAAAVPSAVEAVTSIGMTVTDPERSTAFYCGVLGFTKVDERQAGGPEFDRLWNVAGARARVVHLRLGTEELELTEFLGPKGRPYPADSRSEDLWFQHIAIVVSDM